MSATDLSIIAACFVLALLPPSLDPAIRLKVRQIRRSYHPEARRPRDDA